MMSEGWSLVVTCMVIFLGVMFWMMTALKLHRRNLKYLERQIRLLYGIAKKTKPDHGEVDPPTGKKNYSTKLESDTGRVIDLHSKVHKHIKSKK